MKKPNKDIVKMDKKIAALAKELRSRVDGEVRFDVASRALYSTDASNYRQVPIGVVVPKSKEAIVETVATCRKYDVPILSRGGGTSLAGQCCNTAVVIEHTKYYNQVLEIDPEFKMARVQPGTVLDVLRKKAEKENGLTFGPDPATHTHCTFGGMIGNNSCGIHSVMSGRTVDNIEALEILTYDGVQMWVGETSDKEFERITSTNGRKAEIYTQLKQLIDENADQIRKCYPNIPRRVSGYSLDALLPENGFHVARSLVGSESTCVTVLEAKIKLIHYPSQRTLVVLGYPDVYSAADHVCQIMEFGPIGLEAVDDVLIRYMKKKGLHPEDIPLLPEGNGWLLVEFGADTKEEADDQAWRMFKKLKKEKHPPTMKIFTDKVEEEMVWEIRESGLGATANVPDEPLMWPGWEDSAVDPRFMGDYLRDFRKLLQKFKYDASLYGHFGQGCLHTRIPFDLFNYEGIQKYMKFIDEAADLALKYNGSFSGEHGDGQARAVLLEKMFGPQLIDAFRKFKTIWDPDWKMNPGKKIDAYLPNQNLRLGTEYNPWQPQTHFQFPADGASFSRATLRCVGVGECRRTSDAFMCPSYLATHEEKDTTRGRAHLLFEMFKGDIIKDKWRSKEVKESLDLCLACKGCKSDCPVDVDMAMYKSEFMSHYYERRLRPRAAYSMGLIGYWAGIGNKAPQVVNFFTQTPGLSTIAKAMAGVSQQRRMPRFADETFTAWFKKRPSNSQNGEPILLYPDAFNNNFFPETLQAAVEVLEHYGFRVVLPEGRISSIRPLIHFGMLPTAKREILHTIEQLRPFVRSGVPVLVMEPSTAAVFKEDMLSLFPMNRDAQRLSKLVLLLSDFVLQRELEVPKYTSKAIFHGHCHQKAALKPQSMRELLTKMSIDGEEPEPGCCGMAGAFGLESEHYKISQDIGELNLLPAVRKAAENTLIIADGFSCRMQIMEGTDRKPLHMAQVLQMALKGSPQPVPVEETKEAAKV